MELRGRLRLLLDTHALIWFIEGSPKLSRLVTAEIEAADSEVFVSAVSALEVAIKVRIGKLPQMAFFALDFEVRVQALGFSRLSISTAHATRAGLLDFAHRDPFDRLLIAQAQIEGLHLVSNEAIFDGFNVSRLW